jgi:glucose/arabinose dehydrogenase
MLYATTGDATDGRAAQESGSLAGKILRLTPDGQPAPGNPFAGSPVWSLGHRNVQGIGWDAAGRMYASEFGQNRLDELNLIKPGANYGWPHVEGSGGAPRFTDPLVTWTTDEASPSGILVTGDAVYLAALRGERLWRVPLADGRVGTPEPLLVGDLGRLRDVVLAPDGGSLYVLTNNTARGTPRAGDDRLVRLPSPEGYSRRRPVSASKRCTCSSAGRTCTFSSGDTPSRSGESICSSGASSANRSIAAVCDPSGSMMLTSAGSPSSSPVSTACSGRSP